jgi:hypothetical protein
MSMASVRIRKVLQQVNSIQVFLGPGPNANLVPKFHASLHASHAAASKLTSQFRPKVPAPILTLEFHQMPSSQIKCQNSKFPPDAIRHRSALHHSTLYTSERLLFNLTLPEGQMGTA